MVSIDTESDRSTALNERGASLVAISLSFLARPTKSAGIEITQDSGGMFFMGIV